MHISLLYQTRSLEDHLQLQEAANHQHRYRVDVLNKEHIMSYKEQVVGAGILEYFHVLNVFQILELPAFRASLCRSACREMSELSTGNVFITFDVSHSTIGFHCLSASVASSPTRCHYRYHVRVCTTKTMVLLPVQRFCCIHSLSTAIYT